LKDAPTGLQHLMTELLTFLCLTALRTILKRVKLCQDSNQDGKTLKVLVLLCAQIENENPQADQSEKLSKYMKKLS
jgi:hypothetical protein